MNKIAIYGAGGFGRELLLMMRQINQAGGVWDVIGFFDDGLPKGSAVDQLKVLGGMSELSTYPDELAIAFSVADPSTRDKLKRKITNPRITFPVLIHPKAEAGDPNNRFGQGTILTSSVICTTGILMGDFTIVNLGCTIGHDVRIGNYGTLMPACHISGKVVIGDNVFIGTGASILQNLTIGNSSIVGAGAVVTKNVMAAATVIGIPAKPKE